jgi:sugar O-acyltransferase (sialic acid O-acetyltransferase NeuD family)
MTEQKSFIPITKPWLAKSDLGNPPEAGASVNPDNVMTPRPLLIFPCNGNGIEALDCLGSEFYPLGFIDDEPNKVNSKRFGIPIFGREALERFGNAEILAVPGSPTSFRERELIIASLGVPVSRFARVVHPLARISPLATVGVNVLIMAGVVITSNAVIGDHVCLMPNTVVHHDVVVEDWSLIGSNVTIAGHSIIGRNCYIGSGTSVINGIKICNGVLVGLGSNVIRDVPPSITIAGNPARPLK